MSSGSFVFVLPFGQDVAQDAKDLAQLSAAARKPTASLGVEAQHFSWTSPAFSSSLFTNRFTNASLFAPLRARTGENAVLRLYSIARTVLEWHIKVRGEANPYDPTYTEYFERRRCFAWRTLPREKTGPLVLAGI